MTYYKVIKKIRKLKLKKKKNVYFTCKFSTLVVQKSNDT